MKHILHESTARPRWLRFDGPITGAALVTLLLVAAAACSGPQPPAGETESPAGTAESIVPAPPPGPVPLWQQHIDELQPEVEAWARAWASQDPDAYLAHYSPDFVPPNGLSRKAWEAQRRQRLTRPSGVAVELTDFRRVGFSSAWTGGRHVELVKVRFHQSYASDTFSDEVDKELELELVDLNWRIVTETSL